MPKVVIMNMNALEFSADNQKSILDHILHQQIDWLHSCGAKGKCTTCKMIIKEGENLLTPKSSVEKNFNSLGFLAENERLACQCRLRAELSEASQLRICVADTNKLPHLAYSDC